MTRRVGTRLIGREPVVDSLAAGIGRDWPSRVVTLHSPAGVGKSAVVAAVVEAATAAGTTVLTCRPAAAEFGLSYAALGDLLAEVDYLGEPDSPTTRALERVLARGRAADSDERREPPDPRHVGLGLLGVWSRLATDSAAGLLVVIDDWHWADPESAAAIAFASRRLPATGAVVLAAWRTTEPAVELGGNSVALDPLSDADVRALLAAASAPGQRPTPNQVKAIVATAAGNPLFALELLRNLSVRPPGGARIAVPASLNAVLDERLSGLSEGTSGALAMVALLARPDVATLRRADAADAIEAAEADGLISTEGGRIAFAHPLYGAAIIQRTTAMQRRRFHGRLATAVDTETGACRHAALAAEAPDAVLAQRLEAATNELTARGAIEQAATFASLAAELSPGDDPRRSGRLARAAELAFQTGETDDATMLLALLDAGPAAPEAVFRSAILRATMAFSTSGTSDAISHAERALATASSDSERCEAYTVLARVTYDHFPTAARHAEQAMRLAERSGMTGVALSAALNAYGGTKLMAGGGIDHACYERAIALERGSAVSSADSAFGSYAALLKIVDDYDLSRSMLLEMLGNLSDEGSLPYALSHLPQLELWVGNWDAAEEYAQRHLAAAERTGQGDQERQARVNLATIGAHRGETAEAADIARQLVEDGLAESDAWTERSGAGLLGFLALSDGDAPAATRHLDRWRELSQITGLGEPGYRRFEADHVEALIAVGRLPDARLLVDEMESTAHRFGRPRLIGAAARSRALVEATDGNRASAVEAATAAVAVLEASPLVIDLARARLTLGQIHRRFKEKAAARESLMLAAAAFDRLGAERFSARAHQELARVGTRAPGLALTETEQRVAERAAQGLTVRQIGDELFISPKTVEANLTRVYRKLGISGRAQLARWALEQPSA